MRIPSRKQCPPFKNRRYQIVFKNIISKLFTTGSFDIICKYSLLLHTNSRIDSLVDHIINSAYQYRNQLVVVIPLYALPALVDQTDPTGESYRSARRHSPLQRLVVGRFLLLVDSIRLLFAVVCRRQKQQK